MRFVVVAEGNREKWRERGGLVYNDYGWVGETRDNDLNVDYSYGTSTGPMSPIVR